MAGEHAEADDEITLTFESEKPARRTATAIVGEKEEASNPPEPRTEDNKVEYDEFGLPLKKLARAPMYDDDDYESSDGESPPTQPQNSNEKTAVGATSNAGAKGVGGATAAADDADATPPEPAAVADVSTKEEEEKRPEQEIQSPPTNDHRKSLQTLPEKYRKENEIKMFSEDPSHPHMETGAGQVGEWSHQQIVPREKQDYQDHYGKDAKKKDELSDEWQTMPAYADYDLYDDDGRLIARAHEEEEEEDQLGGAAKGYTRVYDDEDAESVTSMDENTKYLFTENEDDEASRNPLSQMQATKDLLTEGQRIAYVSVCRLALIQMVRDLEELSVKGKKARRNITIAVEGMKMWSQKMMVRLYTHMEISPPEQIMIEQLADHGVRPVDLTPALLKNSRVHNPMAATPLATSPMYKNSGTSICSRSSMSPSLPPYEETPLEETKTPSQLGETKTIDIDLRWTILCDLFLVLIADSVYDARSRVLLERVGKMLDVDWLDICKFEKRVTDALEMQESTEQNWSEQEHLTSRAKQARNKRYMMLGLATVGGGLVIGLSGGLLAPVIGAGLAAGFTTIGIAGTGGFLAGAGGTALIASGAAVSGSVIGGKAGFNRMKSVSTFEFKPLHNAKRVNLIIGVCGWMNGKIDDVRLPFSTVDPIMGDLFSISWEPEMLQSTGQTIGILATEALTQTLQQVLGSTILTTLMASLQLPIVLTKLAYLLDNPWSVSLDRAAAAGLILADTLVHRNLGVRPVTLVGYSLGARVIYYCLRELARVGAGGLVQNAYLFGPPVVVKNDEYAQAVAMVSGRFVNAYAKNDWILGYLFRATSGGIGRVAGLAPANLPGVENVEVTELVNGHMAYRAAMPKLLKKVGWEITSDEFSEIEDPDPENHQVRQRELINELDEARREVEAGKRKPKWSFFGKNKDTTKKKDWETYQFDSDTGGENAAVGKSGGGGDNSVLFDVDAIRAEIEKETAAAAAANSNGVVTVEEEEIQVREIPSTLPSLRISSEAFAAASTGAGKNSVYGNLRASRSDVGVGKSARDGGSERREASEHGGSKLNLPVEDGSGWGEERDWNSKGDDWNSKGGGEITLHFEPESPLRPQRPELGESRTLPTFVAGGGGGGSRERNVWADDYYEDEFREGEVELSFA